MYNHQVVRDKPGILETSIDDTLPYEPNQTLEESEPEAEKEKKEEEEEQPCLDEQIKQLEEETVQPDVQKDLSVPPPTVQMAAPAAPKKSAKKSHTTVCLKSVLLSVVLLFLLSAILFYIIFFSPFEHPFVYKMREYLHFLEPVKKIVGQKVTEAVGYFRE